jgi:hypothetical protein
MAQENTGKNIPSTKTEIEAKFTVPTKAALNKLCRAVTDHQNSSSLFAEIYKHEYVIRKNGW